MAKRPNRGAKGRPTIAPAGLRRTAAAFLEREAEQLCRPIVERHSRGGAVAADEWLDAAAAVLRAGPQPRSAWLRGHRPIVLERVAELAARCGHDPLPFDRERSLGTADTRAGAVAALRLLRQSARVEPAESRGIAPVETTVEIKLPGGQGEVIRRVAKSRSKSTGEPTGEPTGSRGAVPPSRPPVRGVPSLRESYQTVLAETPFFPVGVRLPSKKRGWSNVETGLPKPGAVRPGDFLLVAGGIERAEPDGPYEAIAVDREYNAPLHAWAWLKPMRLPRIGVPVLDRVADLARLVRDLLEWVRQHPDHPRSGRLPDGQQPPHSAPGVQRADGFWSYRVVKAGLSNDPAYPFPLSAFGQLRILGVLLAEKARELLDNAPVPAALVALSRIAGESDHPQDWPLARLADLDEIRSELRRTASGFIKDEEPDRTPPQNHGGNQVGEASTTIPKAEPTARDLSDAAGISLDTLGRIREAAGIRIGAKGGKARNRRYSPSEVDRMVAAALAGNFFERRAIAKKWAKWGNCSADTPQGGE